MKLTVERSEFWRGISTVLEAVASKPAQPVLSNVLLEAEEDSLVLAATNLNLSIRTRVGASVAQGGRVTVPARTLADIAREWPDTELELEVVDGRLVLSGLLGAGDGGEGKYTLAVTPPDEFPDIPESLEGLGIDVTESGEVDGDLIRGMIEKTSFAVSRDETRPVLNGVLWRIEPDFMAMVATDGSRLAEFRQNLNRDAFEGESGSAEVILPPQICTQLMRLLDSEDELEKVILGETQVLFQLGETRLVSRLIEGPYVDYEQVIPRSNDKRLKMAVDQLLAAVRRVSVLSSTYTHQVRVTLDEQRVELTASSQEIGGEAREVIPADYSEERLELAYNAQYLLEVLRKLGTADVIVDVKDAVTAAVVRPGDQREGIDHYYLLMPMRPSS